MSKFTKIFFCVVVAAAALAGCTRRPDCPVTPQGVSTRHTTLLYLGIDVPVFRDNDWTKVEILRKNWSSHYDGNLLVYADRGLGRKPVLIRIYNDGIQNVADTVILYPDAVSNSADKTVFGGVLNDVKTRYPASSYGLTVLSHASGWIPKGTLANPRSIIADGSDEMELIDFAAAIPPDMPMDYIIFDACMMAGVEVAYQLKDKTKYLVSSPAEVWEPGFPYAQMMGYLMQSTPDLAGVAYDFYRSFNEFWYWAGIDWTQSATVSVVKSSALTALADATKVIIEGKNGESLIDISQLQTFYKTGHKVFFDFGQYVEKMHAAQGMPDIALKNFKDALAACVISKHHTEKYATEESREMIRHVIDKNAFSGLTVYIPGAGSSAAKTATYNLLEWKKAVNTYVP